MTLKTCEVASLETAPGPNLPQKETPVPTRKACRGALEKKQALKQAKIPRRRIFFWDPKVWRSGQLWEASCMRSRRRSRVTPTPHLSGDMPQFLPPSNLSVRWGRSNPPFQNIRIQKREERSTRGCCERGRDHRRRNRRPPVLWWLEATLQVFPVPPSVSRTRSGTGVYTKARKYLFPTLAVSIVSAAPSSPPTCGSSRVWPHVQFTDK